MNKFDFRISQLQYKMKMKFSINVEPDVQLCVCTCRSRLEMYLMFYEQLIVIILFTAPDSIGCPSSST